MIWNHISITSYAAATINWNQNIDVEQPWILFEPFPLAICNHFLKTTLAKFKVTWLVRFAYESFFFFWLYICPFKILKALQYFVCFYFESAKMRALLAYVLTCQCALCGYVLTCQRPCVLPCSPTRLAFLHAHLLTYLACLLDHISMCFACLSAHAPMCLVGLRAHVLTSFACLRAYVPTYLACLHTNVPTCTTCLRANVLWVLTCPWEKHRKMYNVYWYRSYTQTFLSGIFSFHQVLYNVSNTFDKNCLHSKLPVSEKWLIQVD